jgi:DNA-binding LacI/PurR family transcriptional regulator
MKVTMEDVARAAKVCRATVSLALRDQPQIPAETRRRIRSVAERLGYAPHPLVSALMATRRKTRTRFQATLGFLTCHDTRAGWRSSPAYAAFFDGARDRAALLGYKLQDFWMREPGVSSERLNRILQARGIHGLILAPLPAEDARLPAFDWHPFSVLAVGYSIRDPEFHRISHDYFHGMTLALNRCRAHGYRRIGFFLDQRVNRVLFNLWLAAYLAEQRTAPGAARIDPLLIEGDDRSCIGAWIHKSRLDALVGLDLWRLPQQGVRVPKAIELVSLNADESPVPIAGIARDFAFMGAAAIDRTVSLLHVNDKGAPARPQTILVEGLWTNDSLLPTVGVATLVG